MTMSSPLYAVYPGTITDYAGIERTFTALELATLYGVQAEAYRTILDDTDWLNDMEKLNYIHLKPRQDNYYRNIKEVIMDDGEETTMGIITDPTKVHQTDDDRVWVDPDEEADREELQDL